MSSRAYPYLEDILDQPRALRDTADLLARTHLSESLLVRLRSAPLILTGMGSSLWALLPLYQRLRALGLPCWWVETSELLASDGSHRRPDTVVIAASQSGASAEIVTFLADRAAGVEVVAITNTIGSPLDESSDTTVLVRAGAEAAVSTKTYVTTLLAAEWLGDQIVGTAMGSADGAIRAADDYLASSRDRVAALRPLVDGVRAFFVVGRGASLGTTGTAALVFKESVQVPTEGLSGSAFRHGPLEMAPEAGIVTLALEGADDTKALQHRLVADVHRIGGVAHLFGADATEPYRLPRVATRWLPLVEILPMQLITVAIGENRGVHAGEFRHLSKVTTVE